MDQEHKPCLKVSNWIDLHPMGLSKFPYKMGIFQEVGVCSQIPSDGKFTTHLFVFGGWEGAESFGSTFAAGCGSLQCLQIQPLLLQTLIHISDKLLLTR